MKYMGSKARIAKHILPIMLKDRKEGQYWVEPFVGGANMIDKVDGNRIGADSNEYLIKFWNDLINGFIPPIHLKKEDYYKIKCNKEENKTLTLWAGICCSYGGKWFRGWINDYKEDRRLKNGRLPNYQIESRNSILKQLPNIKNVDFRYSSYINLNIPDSSIIYCDPPYENTTAYKDNFNHLEFWEWCREKSLEGHTVFISEYNAPDDFECLIEIHTNTQLGNGERVGNQKKIEKLFRYKYSNQK